MDFIAHILILIGIYAILTTSLNLISGYTGLLSIAHAAFYGMGAYISVFASLYMGLPFYANLIFTPALCAGFGVLVAIPCLRISDDYLVIATLAFQVIVFNVLNNWVSVTGGSMGIRGIPQPELAGWKISSTFDFLLLTMLLYFLTAWVSYRLVCSPFGRVLMAIRDDEVFAMALGKRTSTFKLKVFALGAGLASFAGIIYAHYLSFIDPLSFTINDSVMILAMLIIGGSGTLRGPIVGAALLVLLPEGLRFVGFPSSLAGNLRQIAYGTLLVVFLIYRPQGFMGKENLHGDQGNESR